MLTLFASDVFQIPEILPRFKSPNGVLNECFGKILLNIKNGDELDVVNNLVNFSVGLKKAMRASPLEAADLQERLEVVQDILVDVMHVNTMDNEHNVLLLVESRSLLNKEFSETLHCAKAFIQGPLVLCLQHQFLSILGTRQVHYTRILVATYLIILVSLLFTSYTCLSITCLTIRCEFVNLDH